MGRDLDFAAEHLLSDEHRNVLRNGSGISDATIAARGYRTVTVRPDLEELGFGRHQCRVPGLLLPVHTPDGGQPTYVYRPDVPRVLDDKRKGRLPDGTYHQRVLKYEFPAGGAMRLDCPPACREKMGDPRTPLWITEGQKKADALASHGLCAIDVLGVWNWKGRNPAGGSTVLADFDYIALQGRDVRIVFDSDVMTKPQVQAALRRLIALLQNKGAYVRTVYLPPTECGAKQGVDDYLVDGHTVADLERLVESPRLVPQPAPDHVELLEDEPEAMSRPVALIGNRGYVAFWSTTKVEVRETAGRNGEIVRHDPPLLRHERRLFVMRDDGRLFSQKEAVGLPGFAGLGFEVNLPEEPKAARTWSVRGVKAYREGRRPDPGDLFRRVAEVVDRFLDFSLSLAEQQTMCELIACYVMATYFLPAFTVTGFLWPNGDRGSGKTQLLNVVCEMAYLGVVLLAGGSFAALRDLADYGACLAFDDAENVSDPKRMDPDKRALLLAGNRRGATVPLKEPDGERGWHTRYVSTFCPRLFSAIRLPDPVLASRTIVVPLVRTPDRKRANADVFDFALWPHDQRSLVDDLWAVALAHLSSMPGYEARVNRAATLTGRNLEPWRSVLAVALWLQEAGGSDPALSGLFDRLNRLSVAYQAERETLEPADLKAVVLQALSALLEAESPQGGAWKYRTSRIVEATLSIIRREEVEIEESHVTSYRVGRILAQMRLERKREGGTGSRYWIVRSEDVQRALEAHGLPGLSREDGATDAKNTETAEMQLPHDINVTNVTSVTSVTTEDDEETDEVWREWMTGKYTTMYCTVGGDD